MNTFNLTNPDIYKPQPAYTFNTTPIMGGLQSILANENNNWGQTSEEDEADDVFMIEDEEDFEIDPRLLNHNQTTKMTRSTKVCIPN
jgi:hypothetical protein